MGAGGRWPASLSEVSTASASPLPRASLISAAVSESASARLPDTTTVAPALASSTAEACPMPLPPPVTQAIFPLNVPIARPAGSDVLVLRHHGSGQLDVPALRAVVASD